MTTIKQRLLQGWNFTRILYSAVGLAMVAQSLAQHDWMWALMGGYLMVMGIFAIGCASGNGCAVPYTQINPKTTDLKNTEFEEIKTK